jgi:hypothetical protein
MDLEEEARLAFKNEFSQAYLDHIDKDSTATVSIVEILWAGFAHGYIRALHDLEE